VRDYAKNLLRKSILKNAFKYLILALFFFAGYVIVNPLLLSKKNYLFSFYCPFFPFQHLFLVFNFFFTDSFNLNFPFKTHFIIPLQGIGVFAIYTCLIPKMRI